MGAPGNGFHGSDVLSESMCRSLSQHRESICVSMPGHIPYAHLVHFVKDEQSIVVTTTC